MTWKLDKPYSGYNVGQLLGLIQADKEGLTNEEKRKRNLAMGISALLGGVDTRARAKQTKVVNTLNQSKTTDIAKSSKMYDDAEALQTVEESINKYGGGINGALIHYDPEAELAFNVKHEDNLKYFEGSESTNKGRGMKKTWKDSFIKDNLYAQHTDKYTGSDAARISELSEEEYNQPVQDYYSAKVNYENDPANLSLLLRIPRKAKEILGLRTSRDALYDEVLEEEIDFKERDRKINDYRNLYTGQSLTVPKSYTKDTIQGWGMTREEFMDAWYMDEKLNDDYAEVAYKSFAKGEKNLLEYEAVAIGYLTEKSMKDNKIKIDEAIKELESDPEYKEQDKEEQALRRRMATMTALGQDAQKVKLQYDTRVAVNELIQSGAKGYQVPKELADDLDTPDIDEKAESLKKIKAASDLIHKRVWVKARKRALLGLTGDIDWDKERKDYAIQTAGLLYNDVRDEDDKVMNVIFNTRIPTGVSDESKLYGQEYVEGLVEQLYPGDVNKARRQKILQQMLDANYNILGVGGKDDEDGVKKRLEEGTDAYKIILKAQEDYFLHIEDQNIVKHSFMFIQKLKNTSLETSY